MTPAGERPLGELFADLAHQTGALVRQEVRLARAEMSEKVEEAARNGAFIAAGGTLMLFSLLAFATAIVAVVATFLPLWLAALATGLTVALVGYALMRKGMTGLAHINPAPVETMKTLEENKLWVKNELSR